ncbi:MAG TPA: hypothetical protein VH482_21175 [Thermomicrobiales bacterium]
MNSADESSVTRDPETGLPLDFDRLATTDDLEARVRSGEITGEQAAALLQQAARRETAEHGPTLDTDEEGRITTGGFGAGQGMAKQSTNHRER